MPPDAIELPTRQQSASAAWRRWYKSIDEPSL